MLCVALIVLPAVLSMAWYKIVLQPSLVIYVPLTNIDSSVRTQLLLTEQEVCMGES